VRSSLLTPGRTSSSCTKRPAVFHQTFYLQSDEYFLGVLTAEICRGLSARFREDELLLPVLPDLSAFSKRAICHYSQPPIYSCRKFFARRCGRNGHMACLETSSVPCKQGRRRYSSATTLPLVFVSRHPADVHVRFLDADSFCSVSTTKRGGVHGKKIDTVVAAFTPRCTIVEDKCWLADHFAWSGDASRGRQGL